ncbi:MAG TPA: hypothetical protein VMT18_09160 [Planctomycetota bacterium]|nr:hypothetical protein [Planctomycetota bacterium]
MDSTSDLDRLRARLDGRLDDVERARLERELDRDPALAELAERLRDVFALTAAEPEPPACRVTFEDLERRLAPPPRAWPRRAAAAALVVFTGALAWWAFSGGRVAPATDPVVEAPAPRSAPVVRLASLRAEPVAREERAPAWVPEVLADYDPRGPDGIAWLGDQRTAAFVSRAAQRPILLLGSLEGCPWCARMRTEVFADPEAVGLADLYVFQEWNLSELPEKESLWIREQRGYPLLEVWGLDDDMVLAFSGRPSAALFVEKMLEGLERAGVDEDAPAWDELNDWAARWLAADRARAAGRMAEAVAGWRDLVRRARGNALAEEAAAALREVDAEAQRELFAAREIAAHDPRAAELALEDALERYAGTDHASDLGAVLAALRASGAFPTLVDDVSESR